jgi:hypothetical protein
MASCRSGLQARECWAAVRGLPRVSRTSRRGKPGSIRGSLRASHFSRALRHCIEVEPVEHRPLDLGRQFEMRQFLALLAIEFDPGAVTGMVVARLMAHLNRGSTRRVPRARRCSKCSACLPSSNAASSEKGSTRAWRGLRRRGRSSVGVREGFHRGAHRGVFKFAIDSIERAGGKPKLLEKRSYAKKRRSRRSRRRWPKSSTASSA